MKLLPIIPTLYSHWSEEAQKAVVAGAYSLPQQDGGNPIYRRPAGFDARN